MTGYTSGKITHDPMPFTSATGTRFAYPLSTRPIVGLAYAPRPEFDNHNPILVEFRKGVRVAPERDWVDIFLSTLPDWESGEVAHARRVLTKLAALTKEEA